ncbi:unnamed protein product [Rhizoctonia solani]|uniref:Uncharacterized protein n=1 Tax=Rhizoctonia solani TaxID=456999 RepID=A0A8H3HB55_9AGAM|nr:unnamed protein product [Rhizoctonia solani]
MRRPYPVMEFKAGHKYDCRSVALAHPDGIPIIFTGTDDREQIKVWDLRVSACMYELATGNNEVNSLCWDANEDYFEYGFDAGEDRVYRYVLKEEPDRYVLPEYGRATEHSSMDDDDDDDDSEMIVIPKSTTPMTTKSGLLPVQT